MEGSFARLRMPYRCGAKMIVQQAVTEAVPIRETMIKMGVSPMLPPRGRAPVGTGDVEYVFED